MDYLALNKEKLEQLLDVANDEYKVIRAKGYNVDISRGKPCSEQLDVGMQMYDFGDALKHMPKNYRNYGMLDGIPEMKQLFGDMLGLNSDEIIVCGNSSLNLMYDTVQRNLQFGVCGSTPWNQVKAKFICPVPGYDRHFAICEHFGIEMISVPMDQEGPVMDIVEKLVALDDTIKGIWCVPKYSNPTGVTYSDDVVDRLAKMKTKAKDFRIFWDNAYCVHDLFDETDHLANIMDVARKYGNEDRIYEFTSTSKITLAGGGVSCIGCSETNKKDILSHLTFQCISYDKVSQYIHYVYMKDLNNLKKIMDKHKEIIKPKFEKFINAFQEEFANDSHIATWTNPHGGYFITLDVYTGCASRVYALCKEAGLTLTKAGAPFPYGQDDKDATLRIAPTFTSDADIDISISILLCCIKKACLEKLIEEAK